MRDTCGRRGIVLLAEDDAADQELTRRALERDVLRADLQVVENGEELLAYLRNEKPYDDVRDNPRPDIILLDLNMPRMDGRQALVQIRNDACLKAIPVVVLTTSQQDEDIVHSYRLGCNSFITKPVEIDKFIHTVRQLGSYWFELVTLPGEHAHGYGTRTGARN
jgi:two-component system response regulator